MILVKVPFSAGGLGKTKGTEKAPDEIIKHLKDFYLTESGNIPVFDIQKIKVNNSDIETSFSEIIKQSEVICKDSKPVFLGGDHSITFPLVKGFSRMHKNPGIIIFDAHPDAENDFLPPTHEDLLPALVNQTIIDCQKIILVGTRNWDKNEKAFLEKNRILPITMQQISDQGLRHITDTIMARARTFNKLYISIDIDVIDSAYAPGTGYPEPAGLTSREFLTILKRLKFLTNIGAIDLVEVNPEKDIANQTSKLASKILTELS